MKTLRLALAQINSTVGDLRGNTEKIIHYINEAKGAGASIVAFPELALTGYPPEDLLLKPKFIDDNLEALDAVREHADGIIAVVGFVDRAKDIYNAAAVMGARRILDVYHKMFLPNYGVFDEVRYFQAGSLCPVYEMGDVSFGVSICEDIWHPEGPERTQALGGAEFIVNLNASPYTIGKNELRERMLATRAADNAAIIAYVNAVGGQDELVFDGRSLVFDERGEALAKGMPFEEELLVVDLDLEAVFMWRLHDLSKRQQRLEAATRVKKVFLPLPLPVPSPRPQAISRRKPPPLPPTAALEPEAEVYAALSLGLRDYVAKNGFTDVVVGLSGGVDSALVAAIAADSLGAARVHALFMPSRYTSDESSEDAKGLAENLAITFNVIPIEDIFSRYLSTLGEEFKDRPADQTEENIQARIRGNLLMAFSNKLGWLVLTTGNKSEMSVGYATLYGDMAGGFALIKDVPKSLVYGLAEWRNTKEGRALIPERILTKEPTAELRPGQKDTDTLPPYDVLDPILKAYIEEERSFEEILALGFTPEAVKKVIRMIERSEYKRRQSPPGVKITLRAFGRDRRFPITNKYRSY